MDKKKKQRTIIFYKTYFDDADEPVDKGGKDIGFSPKELLASALAACTSATVRMYADRKHWPLDEVKIDINLERDEVTNKTVINRKVQFIGTLDDEQRKRLLAVANACPVHKILTNPIEINTSL
ncbi:MAG: OsmC family protein [Cyclobacteriaceae bacterium]|nr:OsmC family protein [Cyclobacteriaceae bacterium]UYN86651.1 MAG: OsmC family protein [Cyclobacteriaceae bacterium]